MDPKTFLGRIAIARYVGTPGNRQVREILTAELGIRGFSVTEHRFATGPGALVAVQLAGAALGAGTMLTLYLAGRPGSGVPTLACVIATIGGIAMFLRARAARSPGDQLVGVNLIARRPQVPVRTWLVAHYDSKGQRLSMAGRIVAVAVAVFGAGGLLVFGWTRATGGWNPVAAALVLPALAGALLLARCRTNNDSPGALDNGSALVALLALTDALPKDAAVGLLFTDAEELGLQGAQALARDHPEFLRGTAVLNFDGLDDDGRTIMLAHRMGPRTQEIGRALGARLARRLPVLVDGMALAPFAAECVTIMRGNWATAGIVHTTRDTGQRLSLAGVESIVRAVAGALSPA